MQRYPHRYRRLGFTLIELLTVIAIISLLISIMLPSLSRAREQAKRVHCQARLHDFGNTIGTYINDSGDVMPPAQWRRIDPLDPEQQLELGTYGWAEILWMHDYREQVRVAENFPVLRNVEGDRYQGYFQCASAMSHGVSAGHYRVYLPAWAAGSYRIQADGRFGDTTRPNPWASVSPSTVPPRLPLMGDSNEDSEKGIYTDPETWTSYIDAGEANVAGTTGLNGNRFSDRHNGGANYLFPDFHVEWSAKLREELAIDWDRNSITDVEIVP